MLTMSSPNITFVGEEEERKVLMYAYAFVAAVFIST